jgi:hypothetical protein
VGVASAMGIRKDLYEYKEKMVNFEALILQM